MAKSEQDRIRTIAGISEANAIKMTGADLMQAALLANAGNPPLGSGKDGARLSQLAGNSKV